MKSPVVHSVARLSVFKTELEIVKSLLRSFDTPRSLTVYMLIEAQAWDELLNLEINPLFYTERDSLKFKYDYQATSILKKNPRVPIADRRRRNAVVKWVQSERRCRSTNEELGPLNDGCKPVPPEFYGIVTRAREYIKHTLGPLNGYALRRIESGFAFSGGRTTHISGISNTNCRKMSSRIYGSTTQVASYAINLPHTWQLADRTIEIVDANVTEFVPKTAKTDRAIAYEPDLNIYIQKGIGSYIAERLASRGIDKTRAGRPNSRLAHRGSRANDYATVDLESASDTVAIECVRLLLPEKWFELLAFARCEFTRIRGRQVRLAKFSSMGNGYTFELETLIFASLCYAVSESFDFEVYGDDICLACEHVPRLRRSLEFLGFKVNEQKSFSGGLFRESCGEDFFYGLPVRPFFLRKDLEKSTIEELLYTAGNGLSKAAGSHLDYYARDAKYLPGWIRCFTACSPTHRYRIPYDYGDVGFAVCKHDPLRPGGNTFKYYSRKPRIRLRDELGAYVATLCGTRVNVNSSLHSDEHLYSYLRMKSSRTATKKGSVFDWPTLGPWI